MAGVTKTRGCYEHWTHYAAICVGWIARLWSRRWPLSLEALVKQLALLADEGRFGEIADAIHRHPYAWFRARHALTAPHPDPHAMHLAELMVAAWIGLGNVGETGMERWMLPLLRCTSERYLSRVAIAQHLVHHLAHVSDPSVVVKAVETCVPPRTPGDYSNFRTVFSMETWPLLRRHLSLPKLVSELDLFVTAADRASFWREFSHPGRDA